MIGMSRSKIIRSKPIPLALRWLNLSTATRIKKVMTKGECGSLPVLGLLDVEEVALCDEDALDDLELEAVVVGDEDLEKFAQLSRTLLWCT